MLLTDPDRPPKSIDKSCFPIVKLNIPKIFQNVPHSVPELFWKFSWKSAHAFSHNIGKRPNKRKRNTRTKIKTRHSPLGVCVFVFVGGGVGVGGWGGGGVRGGGVYSKIRHVLQQTNKQTNTQHILWWCFYQHLLSAAYWRHLPSGSSFQQAKATIAETRRADNVGIKWEKGIIIM